MKPTLFSVKDANALIPRVDALVMGIMDAHGRLRLVSQEINELFGIWGETVYERTCQDNATYNDKLKERMDLLGAIQKNVTEIRDLGGVVKDLTTGIIDFYHEQDGDLVFLCWKHGESEIQHWHRLHEGYASRKPFAAARAA